MVLRHKAIPQGTICQLAGSLLQILRRSQRKLHFVENGECRPEDLPNVEIFEPSLRSLKHRRAGLDYNDRKWAQAG
jgi:hypothetical protein